MSNTTIFTEMFKIAEETADADFTAMHNIASTLRDNIYESIKERLKVVNTSDIAIKRSEIEPKVKNELGAIRKYIKEENRLCIITNIVMQFLASMLLKDGACVARADLDDTGTHCDLVITFFPDKDITYLTIEEVNEELNRSREEYIR